MSLYNPQRGPRPRLTLAILRYAVVDVLGMVLFALGLAYLVRGPGVFSVHFPSGTADAVISLLAGLALMFWGASRILREVITQQSRSG